MTKQLNKKGEIVEKKEENQVSERKNPGEYMKTVLSLIPKAETSEGTNQ